MADIETVPCKTCGTPTQMLGTKLCDGCYEVQSRLGDYLRVKNGRRFVAEMLEEMRKERVHVYHQCTPTSAPRCPNCHVEVADHTDETWVNSEKDLVKYLKKHPRAIRCTDW